MDDMQVFSWAGFVIGLCWFAIFILSLAGLGWLAAFIGSCIGQQSGRGE